MPPPTPSVTITAPTSLPQGVLQSHGACLPVPPLPPPTPEPAPTCQRAVTEYLAFQAGERMKQKKSRRKTPTPGVAPGIRALLTPSLDAGVETHRSPPPRPEQERRAHLGRAGGGPWQGGGPGRCPRRAEGAWSAALGKNTPEPRCGSRKTGGEREGPGSPASMAGSPDVGSQDRIVT